MSDFVGEIHPLAGLWPMMADADLDALAADIRANGLRFPIVLDGSGRLIDGRNRWEACRRAGIEPSYVTQGVGEEEIAGWIDSANLHRRHLTREQKRDILAARIKAAPELSDRQHAEAVGASPTTAGAVRRELEDGVQIGHHAERVGKDGVRQPVCERPPAPRAPEPVALDPDPVEPEPEPDPLPTVEPEPEPWPEPAAAPPVPHVAHNSGEDNWHTPAAYLDAARAVMGSIDTDPASSEFAQTLVRAGVYHTAETNGLDKEWHGSTWLNPPYSSTLIRQFIPKLVDEYVAGRTRSAIVLVNNATETAWCQLLLEHAAAVCFPRGRISYLDRYGRPALKPLQGQLLAYLGPDPAVFADRFSTFGQVVTTWSSCDARGGELR